LNPDAFFSSGLVAADKCLFQPMKISIEENLLQMNNDTEEIHLPDPEKKSWSCRCVIVNGKYRKNISTEPYRQRWFRSGN
jgi:hypothetical protein